MATGFAPAIANAVLDSLARAIAWTPPAEVWIQLHTADPGAAGTANVAANTTRKQATFGSAASGGSISNTVAVAWSSVSATETYVYFSAWSASMAGTFLFSGALSATTTTAGDSFTVAIGDLDLVLGVAN